MQKVVVGAGAQGRVLVDILGSVEVVDDNAELWGTTLNGSPIIGDLTKLTHGNRAAVIALGNPKVREKVAKRIEQMGVPFAIAKANSAVVMPSAEIQPGCTLHPLTVINSNAKLGKHVLVNNHAVIEHDTEVGDFATICSGVQVGGRCHIGEGAFIGTGAIVLPRVKIGAGSIVAAGSLVSRDVPPNVLVMGQPARVVQELGPDFDWNRLL